MKMTGEELISAPRKQVWAALNDAEILKQCIPGCQEVRKISDTEFDAKVTAKVGPVKANFTGKVKLSKLNPPTSYVISGEGKGGVAGFAKGGASVHLSDAAPGVTKLAYDVDAQVGGKLAQIGSRLVDSTARKMAGEFFTKFNEVVSKAAPEPARKPAAKKTAAAKPARKTAAKAAPEAPAAPPPAKPVAKAPAATKAPAAAKPAARATTARATSARASATARSAGASRPAKTARTAAASRAAAKPAAADSPARTVSPVQTAVPAHTAPPPAPEPVKPAEPAAARPAAAPAPTRPQPAPAPAPAGGSSTLWWVLAALAVLLVLYFVSR